VDYLLSEPLAVEEGYRGRCHRQASGIEHKRA
jgi:hypothetical protein